MSNRKIRIPPLPVQNWNEEQKQVLMSFIEAMPSDFQGGHKDGETDYTALELILNHPSLAKSFLGYSHWLLQNNELPARDREFAILRVAVLIDSEYEWAQHVRIAQHEGIPEADILRIRDLGDTSEWKEQERLLLVAVDEMVTSAFINNDTWTALTRYYNTRQLMEIMFTVGSYQLMGMVYNTMGAPLNEKLRTTLDMFPLEK